jgi:predicted CDP-diglyceride synthetase/phosphatidate cytidylyltransferase
MAAVPAVPGAVTGVLVAGAVAGGRLVAGAVAEDLDMAASSTVVGRAAFLDRTIPAIFAAPVVYHFLKSVL